MFKFIDGLLRDVIAIEATGKVTHEDYCNTLIPRAEAMMAKGPISRWPAASRCIRPDGGR